VRKDKKNVHTYIHLIEPAHSPQHLYIHWKVYSIMLPDGYVEAGGILQLRDGVNPPVSALICYIGLPLLLAVTIYVRFPRVLVL